MTNKQVKTINLWLAMLFVLVFTIGIIFAGYSIGYKYFWQKFETTSVLDQDLLSFSAKVKENPKDAESWSKLAWLAYQKKKYDITIESSKKVLDLVPDEPNALYVLGLTYYEQKSYPLAEQEFLLLYQKYPKNSLALLGLSKTYLAKNQPMQAVPLLESLIHLNKTMAEGHLYLGEAYFGIGEKTKAVSEFNEVLRFSPENQLAKDWLTKLENVQPQSPK